MCRTPRKSTSKLYAYSPYITWYPSHWNELRLEYTYTQPYGNVFFPGFENVNPTIISPKANNMVTLQWAWIIGSHCAWVAGTLTLKEESHMNSKLSQLLGIILFLGVLCPWTLSGPRRQNPRRRHAY